MPIVLLIRHAQASFGAADYDVLSDLGLEQVRALHSSLTRRGIVPDCVVTGALKRQRDTASPWVATTADPRWNEYNDDDVLTVHSQTDARLERHGDGRPTLTSREFQMLLDAALNAWAQAGDASGTRETWPQFMARITGAFDDFAGELTSGQTGMIFSSSGVISALTASLIGAPEAFVPLNRISINTSVTKILVGGRGKTLVSYNEHGHLEEAGDGLVTYR